MSTLNSYDATLYRLHDFLFKKYYCFRVTPQLLRQINDDAQQFIYDQFPQFDHLVPVVSFASELKSFRIQLRKL